MSGPEGQDGFDVSDSERRAQALAMARRSAKITYRDFRWAVKSVILNSIGGSSLMPRLGRVALLSAYGADIQTTGIMGGCTFEGNTRNLHIGPDCFFNTTAWIESVAEVRIGKGVGFAMEVMVLTSDHDIDEDGRWVHEANPKPVTIEDGVWVGARATILPGVTIGEGTVIAAGAVVTLDCEPWSLDGGVPA
jgi:acetyltransferase-like isoleucine patch superfamily enzyme